MKRFLLGPGFFRMFLATLVVLGHTTRLAFQGWAVFVFFILSGYWIAKMYSEQYVRARSPFLTFAVSRYLRLAPLFFVCVALDLLVLFLLGPDREQILAALSDPSWLLHNIAIIGSAHQRVFLPTIWSLDVEIRFYLVAPLLLMAADRFPWSLPVGLLMLVPVSILAVPTVDVTANAFLGTYLALFLAGVAIHRFDWRPTVRQGVFSLGVFFAICSLLLLHADGRQILLGGRNSGPMLRYNPPLGVIGALMIVPYLAVSVRSPSTALDRHLGNLSYAVYLFHLIPVAVLAHYLGHLPPLQRLPGVLLTWMTAFSGAWLLYLVVDQPMDRLRRRFVESRRSPAVIADRELVGERAGAS